MHRQTKNEIEIHGEWAYLILNKKTGEKIKAVIDTEDIPLLQRLDVKWHEAKRCEHGIYVQANLPRNGKSNKTMQLHREIMNCPPKLVVDHINGDTLDNRKSNLRITTNAKNIQNRTRLAKHNKSGVHNVYRNRTKWVAQVRLDKQIYYLGRYTDIEDARKAVKAFKDKTIPGWCAI